MAIRTIVCNDFLSTFVDSINIFDCRLSGVIVSILKMSHLLVSVVHMCVYNSYFYAPKGTLGGI